MSEKRPVVAAEVAEVEFNRFLDLMDVYADESSMDKDDLDQYNKQKYKILKAIQNGHLIIEESGEPIYTPWKSKKKDPIKFHDSTGATLMASDGVTEGHNVAAAFRMMGDMCKVESKTFANMSRVDLGVCMAIFVLLMG